MPALAADGLIAGVHSSPFLAAPVRRAESTLDPGPDLELLRKMLAAAGGTLRTMTYAPELPGAGELVRVLTDHGVTPSLGHTDADARLAADSLAQVAELIGGAAAGAGFGPRARPTP